MGRLGWGGLLVLLVGCGDSSLGPSFRAVNYELVAADGAPLPRPLYGAQGGDTTYLLAGDLQLVPPDSGLLTLETKLSHLGQPPELYTSHAALRFQVRDGELLIFRREYAEPPTAETEAVIEGDQLRWSIDLNVAPALLPPQLIQQFWFRRR
jgi:hypothetical protein